MFPPGLHLLVCCVFPRAKTTIGFVIAGAVNLPSRTGDLSLAVYRAGAATSSGCGNPNEPAAPAVTSQLLEMSGYIVIVAGSARDALLCFERTGGSIDLLITDLVLDDVRTVSSWRWRSGPDVRGSRFF